MERETVLFKTEENMSRNEVAKLFRTLAKKIEKGKVVLQQGTEEVKLKIPKRVELEVKAEKEVGKRRTKKNLSWKLSGWLALPRINKKN